MSETLALVQPLIERRQILRFHPVVEELVHHLACAHLAHAGHGLEQLADPHLRDDLVVLGLVDHLDEGGPGVLEPVLDLRALAPRCGSFLEGSLSLLWREGRQGH